MIGAVPEREVLEILLLNIAQSVEAKHPVTEPVAVAHVIAEAEPPMTEIGLDSERAPEAVKLVVATLEMVPLSLTHVSCPAVHGVAVAIPEPDELSTPFVIESPEPVMSVM